MKEHAMSEQNIEGLVDHQGVIWPYPESNPPKDPPPVVEPETKADVKVETRLEVTFPKTRPRLKDSSYIHPDLLTILCWPRCHDSEGEKRFGDWLLTKLNKMKVKPVLRAQNCITVEVGKGTTLFSCHIDTCHNEEEKESYQLLYDANKEELFLDETKEVKDKKKNGSQTTGFTTSGSDPGWSWKNRARGKVASCLGADDGAGVWMLLQMIEAKIPGAYIFHRGEERGGIGANAMLSKDREWLKKYKSAVAFDRAGDADVVTTQGGTKCCSNEYAEALCKALTSPEMAIKYETSTGGTFTDTKVYIGVIPECVNISVGYKRQHGPDESLDYGHLYALLDIVKHVKWDELPIRRDPNSAPTYTGSTRYGSGSRGGYGGYYGYQGNEAASGGGGNSSNSSAAGRNAFEQYQEDKKKKKTKALGKSGFFDSVFEELYEQFDSSEDVALWLEQDDQMAGKVVMQLIIEARSLELKYQMLLKKTLEAE
jgi:hypothetical protein